MRANAGEERPVKLAKQIQIGLPGLQHTTMNAVEDADEVGGQAFLFFGGVFTQARYVALSSSGVHPDVDVGSPPNSARGAAATPDRTDAEPLRGSLISAGIQNEPVLGSVCLLGGFGVARKVAGRATYRPPVVVRRMEPC